MSSPSPSHSPISPSAANVKTKQGKFMHLRDSPSPSPSPRSRSRYANKSYASGSAMSTMEIDTGGTYTNQQKSIDFDSERIWPTAIGIGAGVNVNAKQQQSTVWAWVRGDGEKDNDKDQREKEYFWEYQEQPGVQQYQQQQQQFGESGNSNTVYFGAGIANVSVGNNVGNDNYIVKNTSSNNINSNSNFNSNSQSTSRKSQKKSYSYSWIAIFLSIVAILFLLVVIFGILCWTTSSSVKQHKNESAGVKVTGVGDSGDRHSGDGKSEVSDSESEAARAGNWEKSAVNFLFGSGIEGLKMLGWHIFGGESNVQFDNMNSSTEVQFDNTGAPPDKNYKHHEYESQNNEFEFQQIKEVLNGPTSTKVVDGKQDQQVQLQVETMTESDNKIQTDGEVETDEDLKNLWGLSEKQQAELDRESKQAQLKYEWEHQQLNIHDDESPPDFKWQNWNWIQTETQQAKNETGSTYKIIIDQKMIIEKILENDNINNSDSTKQNQKKKPRRRNAMNTTLDRRIKPLDPDLSILIPRPKFDFQVEWQWLPKEVEMLDIDQRHALRTKLTDLELKLESTKEKVNSFQDIIIKKWNAQKSEPTEEEQWKRLQRMGIVDRETMTKEELETWKQQQLKMYLKHQGIHPHSMKHIQEYYELRQEIWQEIGYMLELAPLTERGQGKLTNGNEMLIAKRKYNLWVVKSVNDTTLCPPNSTYMRILKKEEKFIEEFLLGATVSDKVFWELYEVENQDFPTHYRKERRERKMFIDEIRQNLDHCREQHQAVYQWTREKIGEEMREEDQKYKEMDVFQKAWHKAKNLVPNSGEARFIWNVVGEKAFGLEVTEQLGNQFQHGKEVAEVKAKEAYNNAKDWLGRAKDWFSNGFNKTIKAIKYWAVVVFLGLAAKYIGKPVASLVGWVVGLFKSGKKDEGGSGSSEGQGTNVVVEVNVNHTDNQNTSNSNYNSKNQNSSTKTSTSTSTLTGTTKANISGIDKKSTKDSNGQESEAKGNGKPKKKAISISTNIKAEAASNSKSKKDAEQEQVLDDDGKAEKVKKGN